MSALALMLHQMGHKVQGSDVEKYYFTQRGLEQAGIPILPFDEKNITEDVELIAGNAFREDNNVEVAYAIKNGYSFKRYHEFLGHFMDQFTSFGVASFLVFASFYDSDYGQRRKCSDNVPRYLEQH